MAWLERGGVDLQWGCHYPLLFQISLLHATLIQKYKGESPIYLDLIKILCFFQSPADDAPHCVHKQKENQISMSILFVFGFWKGKNKCCLYTILFSNACFCREVASDRICCRCVLIIFLFFFLWRFRSIFMNPNKKSTVKEESNYFMLTQPRLRY